MGRFEGQPRPAGDAVKADRLKRAGDEITRLRARISALEQALESETRIRLEAGALLASEGMRTRQLEQQLAAQAGAPEPARRPSELETVGAQIHPMQADLERGSRRWWQRRRLT